MLLIFIKAKYYQCNMEALQNAHQLLHHLYNSLSIKCDTALYSADAAIQASYNGQEVTTQAGVNIIGLGGTYNNANAASEGFDEPLTGAQVLTIVNPFMV